MDYKKVPQEINDIAGDNVKLLAQLFPSAVKDGQVDFDALKEELGQFQEVDKEKYELTWAGKQDSKKKAQEDVYNRTLKYIPEDSKNPEITENLYIEGDNLEVLKLLRQNYYGAIKMIYIDPPYNTGNDFVYNDNFAMSSRVSDIAEGIRDDEGNPLQRNQKSSSRYHTDWINMMYPRLKVAKDLLTDGGVIFISIDDNEVDNLKKICNEVFGEDNQIGTLVWKKKYTGGKHTSTFADYHEFVCVYTKNITLIDDISMKRPENEKEKFNLVDEYVKERGKYYIRPLKSNLDPRPTLVYPIELPDGSSITTQWICAEETFKKMKEDGRILIRKKQDGQYQVYKKYYEKDGEGRVKIPSFLEISSNNEAKEELKRIFDIKQTRDLPFDTPKPLKLISFFVENFVDSDDVILDFFSGSATTAHAVMQLNAEDGGNRKFICVQLPESTDEKDKAYKAGYVNICEIGKERIRRAGEKIIADNKDKEGIENLDIGFKVFRTADTNIKWNLYEEFDSIGTKRGFNSPDEVDFIEGFNDMDVVYEVMLRQKDVPLSSSLEILKDIGERTYLYGSTYLVCLETEITERLIDKLAALDPLPIKYIFRDSAFKDDINLKDETFRRLKNLIERNTGLEKKSYTVEFI